MQKTQEQDTGDERVKHGLTSPWELIRTVLAAAYYAVRILLEIHR